MLPLSGPNLKHICLTCPLFVGPKTFWHILCLEFSSVVYQSNALALKEEELLSSARCTRTSCCWCSVSRCIFMNSS